MVTLTRRILVTSSLAILLAVAVGTGSAAAHGMYRDFITNYQYYSCERWNGGVQVRFKTAELYADGGWAFVAYNLYGAEGSGSLGRPAYGWTGWQQWNGNYWHAATTGGHRSHWNYGLGIWTQDVSLVAERDNYTSGGNDWWIYTYVWWPDGHADTYWRQACGG